jgi:HEAT repeat protein
MTRLLQTSAICALITLPLGCAKSPRPMPQTTAAAPPTAAPQAAVAKVQPSSESAVEARAATLTNDIRQRDSTDRRQAALAAVRAMLADHPDSQAAALTAIQRTGDIKYDRAGLEAAVVPLLSSPDAGVRRAALGALPNLKPDSSVIDKVAALAADPDPQVRAYVMHSIVFIRGFAQINTPLQEPALTLLGDSEEEVVIETARALWGCPVTPPVEARVIELSNFPADQTPGHKSIPYWMNYFVLSTRPQVSRPVAERLAQIARHPNLDHNWTGRAVWGLAHGPAPEAADTVAKALIEELDNSLNSYNREWAVRGLIQTRTDAAISKLAELAQSTDESEGIRELARGAIGR